MAYIWDATKGMRDLNQLIDRNLGRELTKALSLNSSRRFTGIGELNIVLHVFRIVPFIQPGGCEQRR